MKEPIALIHSNLKYASQVLVVKDLSEAQQYYRDVLGFTIDGDFVRRDGVHFLFKENRSVGAVRPNSHIDVVLDTYIWVNDVDAIYAELRSKGANIIFGPMNMDYNMRDLLIEDLYGYRLCFGGPIREGADIY
ncbi:VOC family protein [Paenibacillus mendelii]|uniref:VOC family protein n=1 Tax=Paenibacillus mendelii TaxID=206163 RepID=A0ABV6JF09_9BACL|nr:VOC family protein [Paenibacillus mendelii]MCQ6557375.1 VOC family protein [Paenibacillus mendelii]